MGLFRNRAGGESGTGLAEHEIPPFFLGISTTRGFSGGCIPKFRAVGSLEMF